MFSSFEKSPTWQGKRPWMTADAFAELVQRGDQEVNELIQKLGDPGMAYLAYHTDPDTADQITRLQAVPALARQAMEMVRQKIPSKYDPRKEALKQAANPVELAALGALGPARLAASGAMSLGRAGAHALGGAVGNTITGVVTDPIVDQYYEKGGVEGVFQGAVDDFLAGLAGGLTVENALHRVASRFGDDVATKTHIVQRIASELEDPGSFISKRAAEATQGVADARKILEHHLDRLEEYAEKAKQYEKSVKDYLHENEGLSKRAAGVVSTLVDARRNLQIPSVEETAQQVLAARQFRDFYRTSQSGLHLIAQALTPEEFRQFITLLALTSRQRGPQSNMTDALNVWFTRKVAKKGIKWGEKERGDVAAAFKDIEDALNIEFGKVLPIRKGAPKVHDFADTLYVAALDPERLKQSQRSVIDFRMAQLFKQNPAYWAKRHNPDGTITLKPLGPNIGKPDPTEHEIEIIQHHLVKVRDYLRQVTGEDWDIDQVQSALWYFIKGKRIEAGFDKPSKTANTYYEALKRNAEKFYRLNPGDFDKKKKDKTDRLIIDMTKQTMRTRDQGIQEYVVDHYGKHGEYYTIADPDFQGTGRPGRGLERIRSGDYVPMIHYYYAGSKPEQQFIGSPMFRSVLRGRFYPLESDPEGIYRQVRGQAGALERELVNRGYDGYYTPYVVKSFLNHPLYDLRPVVLNVSSMAYDTNIEVLKEMSRKLGDPRFEENAEKLLRWRQKIMSGNVDDVMEEFKAEILQTLDHPLIDINEIRYSVGRWNLEDEPLFTVIGRAGDRDILRGKVAELLLNNAQQAGLIRQFIKPSDIDKGIPRKITPTAFLYVGQLDDLQKHRLWELLSRVKLPASTYDPKRGMVDISVLPNEKPFVLIKRLIALDKLLKKNDIGVTIKKVGWSLYETELLEAKWAKEVKNVEKSAQYAERFRDLVARGVRASLERRIPWTSDESGGTRGIVGRTWGRNPYFANPFTHQGEYQKLGAGYLKTGFPTFVKEPELKDKIVEFRREGYDPVLFKSPLTGRIYTPLGVAANE